MLAEDNIEHASAIVQAVETHLQKVSTYLYYIVIIHIHINWILLRVLIVL